MAEIVKMPKLGLTMEEGTIDSWEKGQGEVVEKGEILFSVSTDKLTNEIESMYSGTLLKIIVEEGDTVDVLEPIAVIGKEGEDISGLLD